MQRHISCKKKKFVVTRPKIFKYKLNDDVIVCCTESQWPNFSFILRMLQGKIYLFSCKSFYLTAVPVVIKKKCCFSCNILKYCGHNHV